MLKQFIGPYLEADKDAGTGAGTHSDVTPPPAPKEKAPPAAEDKKPAEPTFVKADVDRLVEEAKASGNQSALKEFLKMIGAKDVEDAKRIAAEYAKLAKERQDADEANKSELEKARGEAAQAKLQGEAAITKAKGLMVEAQITVIAAELGARNRDHVARLMDRAGIEVDLEAASVTGVREALLALKGDTATAYLFAAEEPKKPAETEVKTEDKKPAVQQVPQTPPSGGPKKTDDADQAAFAAQQRRQFNASF